MKQPRLTKETRDPAYKEDVRALHQFLQREVLPLLVVKMFNADRPLMLRLIECVFSTFSLFSPSTFLAVAGLARLPLTPLPLPPFL